MEGGHLMKNGCRTGDSGPSADPMNILPSVLIEGINRQRMIIIAAALEYRSITRY